MILIGPFFYVNKIIIYNTLPLDKGNKQADKLDNPFGHDKLWDEHFKSGDYIDYPRGRVIWDCTNNRAIVYIDKCINKPNVLKKIKEVFELQDYMIEYDDHYCCKHCVGNLFEE